MITNILAALREELDRKEAEASTYDSTPSADWYAEFVERLFAQAEAAERKAEKTVQDYLAAERLDLERVNGTLLDERDALQARVAALEAGLRPFADAYDMAGHHYEDKFEFGLFLAAPSPYTLPAFKAEALRQAKALLAAGTTNLTPDERYVLDPSKPVRFKAEDK